MHPVLAHLFTVASASNGVNSTGSVAIIGGLAVVLAASIPTLLSLREKEPREVKSLRDAAAQERARLEREVADTCVERVAAEEKARRLERLVWRLGYDPETEQRVTHEEHDHDA